MSEQEVLDLVQRWSAAELKGDADGLAELLAEDFTGIGPLGFVLAKQQWVGRYREGGEVRNSAFEILEPQVKLYGDAALVVGVQKQETTYQDHDLGGQFRLGLVAAKQDGRWLVSGVQLSGPLGPPPATPPNFKKQG
jgi:uncharacterized protein (TIGR02246 family)